MNTNRIDIMVDLETLASSAYKYGPVNERAKIIQLGMLPFHPFKVEPARDLYNKVNTWNINRTEGQENRETDVDTLKWWDSQPHSVINRLTPNQRVLKDVLKHFVHLVHNHISKDGHIWARGVCFDIPILKHALDENDIIMKVDHRHISDSRTITNMSKEDVKKSSFEVGDAHNAGDDCISQVVHLQYCMSRILKGEG